MNELWYENFKSIMRQMNNVADKIRETVSKCDEATQILIGRKAFEYYDETSNICEGIPIHPEPITINLRESTDFNEDMICDAEITSNGEELYQFRLGIFYDFDVMGSPKLGDEENVQFWVNIRLGMDKMNTCKELIFDFDTANDYIEKFMQSRYHVESIYKIARPFTIDDFKALISELFDDERNVKMFHDWIDKIVEIVNEFSIDSMRIGGDTDAN
jgi:hypothetical protein